MYILLILFFASFIGIIIMIGKKLVLLRNGQMSNGGRLFEIPYIEEIQELTIKNFKKHSYVGLVATIRFYVRSTNFLKDKYRDIKIKVKSIRKKNPNGNPTEKKEVSKFLKMISDYKKKIKEIKHKIHEEEKKM